MSKKRTSPESSNNEQTNEGSDVVVQQEDNAKRAKLTTLSDTTLQDLPIELIERIIVKAVTMEVKGMKLAKSVWKEKADLVISRLGTVCPQWSNILTTNFFRNELHRTLDGTAQKTIRLEILHQSTLPPNVSTLATLKDEIFVFWQSESRAHLVNVYDRNNMTEVKDVIPLSVKYHPSLTACNVLNNMYFINRENRIKYSILRVTKDDEHQYTVAPFITDMLLSFPSLAVADNGCVILSKKESDKRLSLIQLYDSTAHLTHEIKMYTNVLDFYKVIPKSNGNLVLVSLSDQGKTKLTEIKMDGTILRQYQSSLSAYHAVCQADKYERLMIAEGLKRFELLDSEFNLLECAGLQQGDDQYGIYGFFGSALHYNRERNEVVSTANWRDIVIFHLTEE